MDEKEKWGKFEKMEIFNREIVNCQSRNFGGEINDESTLNFQTKCKPEKLDGLRNQWWIICNYCVDWRNNIVPLSWKYSTFYVRVWMKTEIKIKKKRNQKRNEWNFKIKENIRNWA